MNSGQNNGHPSNAAVVHNNQEIDFLRRERKLLLRELDLARRQNDLLRSSPRVEPEQRQPRSVHINTVKDLLGDFKGNNVDFRKWQEQFKLLCEVYNLNDNHARLLLGAKLKGKALL